MPSPLSPLSQLTVDDKVLLHLSQFMLSEDDPEAPLEATQEGIAEAAGMNATHVPRSVQNLRKKDLLVELKLPVRGSDRRRKSYCCTEAGHRKAQELHARLVGAEIFVRHNDGAVEATTLRDLYGKTITVRQTLEAIRAAESVPLIDHDEGAAPQATTTSPMSAHLYTTIPSVTTFYGRKGELRRFQNALKAPQVRMVAVSGIAGIGKTTFVAKALEKVRRTPVFWYRLHEWETLRNIGFVMADFLAQLERPDLRNYMQGHREHDVAAAYEIVQRDLEGLEAIVVLDDFDKAPRAFMGFIRSFLPQLDRFTGIKFIVVTRTAIPFFSEKDRVEERVVEITLGGLEPQDAKRLIGGRPDAATIESVTRVTEGHPLLLRLFSTAPQETGPGGRGSGGSDGGGEGEGEGDGQRPAHPLVAGGDGSTGVGGGGPGAPGDADGGDAAAEDPEDPRERLLRSEGIHRFLTDEILASLGQSERRALEAASVHRYPVPSELLFVDEEIDHDTVDSLRRRLLLRTVGGRFVEPMDFVREFVYQRLKPEERRRLHEQAAAVIRSAGIPGTGWMVPHHLMAAGRGEEAVDTFLDVAPRYLEKGKREELAALLRDLLGIPGLDPARLRGLAAFRAELYTRAGDEGRAARWRAKAAGEEPVREEMP